MNLVIIFSQGQADFTCSQIVYDRPHGAILRCSCPFSRSESRMACGRMLCVGLRVRSVGRTSFSRWGEGPVQGTGERWPFAVQPVPTQRSNGLPCTRNAQSAIFLITHGLLIDGVQLIRKPCVLFLARMLQRQLDSPANQMRPAELVLCEQLLIGPVIVRYADPIVEKRQGQYDFDSEFASAVAKSRWQRQLPRAG